MKRWQTRGEVQDSDEEEIDLDTETQSLEYPSKRAKIATEPNDNGNDKPNATQRLETQSLDKEAAGKPIYQDETERSTEAFSSDPLRTSDHGIVAQADKDDDNEPAWTTRTITTKTYNRLQGTSWPDATRSKELFPVVTLAKQNAVDSISLQATSELPSSSIVPQDLFASSGEHVQPDLHIEAAETSVTTLPSHGLHSRASSPLSELSDPPGSPPEFFKPADSSYALLPTGPDKLTTGGRVEHSSELDEHALPPALLTQGGRRSLRARQEKQLHPYMYDKAQYQRQCRERGLRPVRLLEQNAQEAQDASLNHDNAEITSSATRPSSSSSSLEGLLSSGTPLEHPIRQDLEQAHVNYAEDDLPDIDRLLQNRAVTGRLQSRKRQKLAQKPHHVTPSIYRDGQDDIFTVPPSPPPSSKDSAPETSKAPQGFRLPRGLSPMPLPTPQISSDIRSVIDHRNTMSESDTPPRTMSRSIARVRSIIMVGSDSSTGSESSSASEDDQRLLHRERKRIRGVLPASWLNIDRKAKPKSPSVTVNYIEQNHSEPYPAPQKGVARKVYRRSTAALGSNTLQISDDDGTSGSEAPTPTAVRRKTPASPGHIDTTAVQNAEQDDDNIEFDWFDPMLAGADRTTRKPGHRTARRSRNTGQSKGPPTLDLREKRQGLRHAYGIKISKQTGTSGRAKSKPKNQRKAPALGILDAPQMRGQHAAGLPQFVRVAARQARRGPEHGRHSPSNKVIRLATHEDTEQANTTLDDWRQGKIPRSYHDQRHVDKDPSQSSVELAQGTPRTPHINTIGHLRDAKVLSVSSRIGSTSAKQKSISTRSAPRSMNNGRQAAKQHATQHQRSRSDGAGLHGGRNNMQKSATHLAVQYRGAQLETQETEFMQQSRTAAFQRRMQCLTEAVSRGLATPALPALPMARFLQESNPPSQRQVSPPLVQPQAQGQAQPTVHPASLPLRTRKRRPQRVDVETRRYRQPSEPLPDVNLSAALQNVPVPESGHVIQGLGPSGTRYATDFDIRHLPGSTYFHESTFIGSGDLAAALAMADRNMEEASGSLRVYINDIMHEWSAWSEQVSDAMNNIPPAISDALKAIGCAPSSQHEGQISAVASNIDHVLRSVIRYLSKCLYFFDAIDRRSCCTKLDQLAQDIMELTEQTEIWSPSLEGLRRQVMQSVLVITRQNQILGDDAVVSAAMRVELRDRTRRTSCKLASYLVPQQLDNLRHEYEEQRVVSIREVGIRKDESILAGMVILNQCLRNDHSSRSLFWQVIGKALNVDTSNAQASSQIDAAWYNIFSILPSLEFDATGIVHNRDDDNANTEWRLPGQLVERCLELYPATSALRGSSVNEYVRATLTRCLHLFTRWHWWKCESLLSTVFDFFARRSLNLLHHEDGHGSPDFLESLADPKEMSLEVRVDDRSFSLFLKLLVTSLQTWKREGLYSDKKIGSIAWRIIPNHARIYRKDAEVRQIDLDALRNHFDLLCTLYFASPPLHRLRVDMLRNLVDHSTSHREACRISVRAWARLASFQMSIDEPLEKLQPFIEWFNDMVEITAAQYRLAHTEAKQQYEDARAAGAVSLDSGILEKTIASNQRQIAATIVDLLAAYRRALTSASCIDAAYLLVTRCKPWKAIDSLHTSERRLTAVYNEMIELFNNIVDLQKRFTKVPESNTQSEDSQDYGDISILQEYATGQAVRETDNDQNLVASMHDALARLVSDAFGSDTSPDDSFLSRLLVTWMQVAKYMVSHGLRSWANYLVDYNAEAWYQLRDTFQRRKFTSYALAAVLEADPAAFGALKSTFLGTWLRSLVERASTLKYQHTLTEALLNLFSDEPVLQNLPFSRPAEAPRYHVTLQELQQRRLALISSVLSNMLEHYNQTTLNQPRVLPALGRLYSDIAQQLMQAMRSNYEELQGGEGDHVADAGVRGDYVIFVQEVVACLQQYAIEGVYTVHRFFLDSSAFPLPADDPTYVVGRLRKHTPKLTEARTRKQLATFLHNISERAVLDQQQVYLSDQLHRAMSGTVETGDVTAPTLRHILTTSIIPAYIEHALSDVFTWILAVPMINASTRTLIDLLYDTDIDNEASLAVAMEQIASLLSAVQRALAEFQIGTDMPRSPHALGVTGLMFNLCEATVVFVNHIQRSTGRATTVLRQLSNLQTRAETVKESLTAPDDLFHAAMEGIDDVVPACQWADTYTFTARHVQQSAAEDWSLVNERYFIKRGNGSREVVVPVGDYAEEREKVLQAIASFQSICGQQNRHGKRASRGRRPGDGAFEMGEIVI